MVKECRGNVQFKVSVDSINSHERREAEEAWQMETHLALISVNSGKQLNCLLSVHS